ncbi:hypothetical protein EMG21_30315 [Klebsiella pneumoniae]|nr:hypothetical protein EMG21_30315 [Klebsiella pneumoniae]
MAHNGTVSGLAACRHKHYMMNCDQFEGLLARANHRCEICERPGVDTEHRQLYIDHALEPGNRDWAVRGLLCGKCNSRLRRGEAFSPEAERFLTNAWYRQQMERAGVPPEGPPEPEHGFCDQFGRFWEQRRGRWSQPNGHGRARHRNLSWRGLVGELGPHNIADSLADSP